MAESERRPYARGSLWTYRTRPHERGSRARIVRVDELEDGRRVYHLFVDGLSLADPEEPDGKGRVLSHLPVGRETLDASLLERVGSDTAEPADFAAGYAGWKREFDQGDAGFFLMPLDEVVQHVEDVLTGIEEGG